VLLRHWLGLSAEETAEDLGMTVAAVEAQAARGLASLPSAATRERG
jgi:DNA-directed RNA polymerase specialized sigma24 family protein